MTDFSNIFLISDMDGTLINSKSHISAINKYALNEFTKAGGTFAVATIMVQFYKIRIIM